MSTVKANNVQVGQSGTATNNFTLYQPSSPDGTVRLAVGNSGATSADVLTANSSGNVGIGVTPESMLSVVRAVRVGQGAMLEGRSNSTVLNLSANQYISAAGQRTYITTGEAAYYEQIVGQHRFFTAPSGTAGTTITFTQVLAVEKDKSLALQGAVPQSGTGITFPATQSASSDANTLDDYEEGTWTPTLTGASSDPTVTYTTQTGQYTKVGRVVHVQCSIVPATYSGGSGVLRIAGLPFTSGSSTFYVTGSAYLDGVDIGASRTWATSYVAPGVSHIRLITSQNNGAASDVLVGGVSAGDNIIIGITYMV